MTSRDDAIRCAINAFDGSDVREEWDPVETMISTITGAGYEALIEVILDRAYESGHIIWTDEHRDQIRQLRGLLNNANEAFDECTGDYAKELVRNEPWRGWFHDANKEPAS